MELDYTIQGEIVGKAWQVKYSNLDAMDEMIPLRLDLDWFQSASDFLKWAERKKEVYHKDFLNEQRQRYKNNYIEAMKKELGFTNEVEKIINALNKMDNTDFYFTSLSTDEGHIRYVYEAKYAGNDTVAEEIAKVWKVDLSN